MKIEKKFRDYQYLSFDLSHLFIENLKEMARSPFISRLWSFFEPSSGIFPLRINGTTALVRVQSVKWAAN